MIFYVSEKIGHLFMDWSSFLCESNLWFLRACWRELIWNGIRCHSLGGLSEEKYHILKIISTNLRKNYKKRFPGRGDR